MRISSSAGQGVVRRGQGKETKMKWLGDLNVFDDIELFSPQTVAETLNHDVVSLVNGGTDAASTTPSVTPSVTIEDLTGPLPLSQPAVTASVLPHPLPANTISMEQLLGSPGHIISMDEALAITDHTIKG